MSSAETGTEINNHDIDSLIETLKSEDGIARQNACNSLVKIGEPALDALNHFETVIQTNTAADAALKVLN